VALTAHIEELGLRDPRGEEAPHERKLGDVVLGERARPALENEGPERPPPASHRHRDEHREALLAEPVDMLVGCMRVGHVGRDGPHVLDGAARDALADREPHLPDGALEAHVSAHDELGPLALEHVERAHVGPEDLGDALRALVEQRAEGHGARGEGHEIEHAVEPRVSAGVDLFGFCHDASIFASWASGVNS
jgi:hypothetical protein